MRKNQNNEVQKDNGFSVRKLCKQMAVPCILGGAIGLATKCMEVMLCAVIVSLLHGIRYCDQFDD